MTSNNLHIFKLYNLMNFDLYVYTYKAIITIKIMNIPMTPQSNFVLLCNILSLSSDSLSHSRQPLICFLTLQISFQFVEFYRNESYSSYSFVWLLLLNIIIWNFIHDVACINSLFLFIIVNYSILKI